MRAFLLVLIFVSLSLAQPTAWQTATNLPGVDLSVLQPAQREAALKLMREMGCTCGCNMKVAQCRVEDPACSYSTGLSAMIVRAFAEGKTVEQVKAVVAGSALGRPRDPQKVLEDPVRIPTSGAPSLGPVNARIELVEFSDFECPYCAVATGEIHRIFEAYPKDVRLVYKQFPLTTHPHAQMAALASLAAYEQGKFWEMHDKMFANYNHLTRERVLQWAGEMGMDVDKFQAAMASAKNKATVQKDLQDGEYAGVSGTPSLYINGKHYNGNIQLGLLKPILDQELKNSHAVTQQ